MSTGTKRPLADALASAERFRALFSGTYNRWEVAGSCRRGCPEVGDVEHVVDTGGSPALWRRTDDLLDEEFLGSRTGGPLTKAVYSDGSNRWGDKYRGVMFEGFRHEVFLADRNNWGAILAIRTGPWEFSRMLVTKLKQGGVFEQVGGYVARTTGGVHPVPDEREFFELCGERWREPSERTAST